jgi:integrase
MPKTRLTAAGVQKLRLPDRGQVDWFDELLPGFGVRTSYNGSKAWFVMVRVKGKLVRSTLGRFPAISLSEARDLARQVKLEAQAGIDPRARKQDAIAAEEQRHANTFSRLAREFLQTYAEPNLRPSTVREYRRCLLGKDTVHLAAWPISDVSKRDVLSVVDRMVARGSKGAAGRMLAYLSKFFSWCVDREVIEVSPVARISAPQPTRSRDRILSANELHAAQVAFEGEGYPFGPLFQLMLLTGQRRGEVAGMRWDELKGLNTAAPVWELSGDRTKNHHPHVVPLSPAAVDVIQSIEAQGSFVFSTNGRTAVSGFGKAKARVDQNLASEGLESDAWTLHDLRRTMVTVMNEELRIAPHVVEAVVNHVSGSAKRGVAGVYNKALYMDERRIALNGWASWLAQLGGQTHKPDNVIALTGGH